MLCLVVEFLLSVFLFQDDKDLVHEFVMAEGLTCLIKVGAEADQNYQNYILRGTTPHTTLYYTVNQRRITKNCDYVTFMPLGVNFI